MTNSVGIKSIPSDATRYLRLERDQNKKRKRKGRGRPSATIKTACVSVRSAWSMVAEHPPPSHCGGPYILPKQNFQPSLSNQEVEPSHGFQKPFLLQGLQRWGIKKKNTTKHNPTRSSIMARPSPPHSEHNWVSLLSRYQSGKR